MKYTFIFLLLSFSLSACSSNVNLHNQEVSDTDSANNPTEKPVVKQLAQSDLATVLAQDSIILIDVRTPGEIAEGVIPGADAFIDYNSADFETKIAQLDKNKAYVVYCRSGGRSGNAANYMIANGFSKVYNLTGGVNSFPGTLVKP